MNVLAIIPVYNPDDKFKRLLNMLQRQSLNNLSVLLIDSGTQHEYKKYIKGDSKFIVKEIASSEFNHGGTRQLGINMYPDKDIYLFLTQDAILADENAVKNLIGCFDDKFVGCAFGRQLPYEDASFFLE